MCRMEAKSGTRRTVSTHKRSTSINNPVAYTNLQEISKKSVHLIRSDQRLLTKDVVSMGRQLAFQRPNTFASK